MRQFKQEVGEARLCEKARPETPETATDESNQEHVEAAIQDNCQTEQKNSAPKLEISKERVGHITSLLRFRKVCARWVP